MAISKFKIKATGEEYVLGPTAHNICLNVKIGNNNISVYFPIMVNTPTQITAVNIVEYLKDFYGSAYGLNTLAQEVNFDVTENTLQKIRIYFQGGNYPGASSGFKIVIQEHTLKLDSGTFKDYNKFEVLLNIDGSATGSVSYYKGNSVTETYTPEITISDYLNR